MSKRPKSFIDLKLSGTLEIVAKSREDAINQVRDRILKEILIEHPTFESTGLPDLWVEWLDSEVEKLVGIEVYRTDEPIVESIEARWTNIDSKKTRRELLKGGKFKL